MPKKKILLVTGIFPPDKGGPATYVPRMASALHGRHEVVGVVTLSDEMHNDASSYAFPVLRIRRGQNRILRFFETVRTIFRLSRAVDVVYANGLVVETAVACTLMRRKRTVVKIVGDWVWERARNAQAFTVDIDTFQGMALGPRWEGLRRLHRWAIRRMDTVITPSRYLAGIVAGWGVPRHRISMVHNAVSATAPVVDVEVKRFDLVTVARLVPWKGVGELCDLANRNGWTLRVIGDGPLRGELESQIERDGSAQSIQLCGAIQADQVLSAMAAARVFVLNSSYEGLPHVVLEAKAAGLPVVATAVGGTPEAVVDLEDGFLVPAGDPEALERRINLLLGDPELRRRMGESGRRMVRTEFSEEGMVAETEAVLFGGGSGTPGVVASAE